jgi:hypothetical protein
LIGWEDPIIAAKKNRPDLEKVAAQLAKVRILPLAEGDHIALTGVATFHTPSFEAGEYKVSIGLTHALLQLEHPSFERQNAYQATLAKETWSESWKSNRATKLAGEASIGVGAKIGNFLRFGAGAEASKAHQESSEQKAAPPYRIVSITPSGWQIGTELGDPRTPAGARSEGLEGCLSGEYVSGRNEERGDGHKIKDGNIALCVLRPNVGGNDPRITATLVGVADSLKIAITPLSIVDANPLRKQSETRSHEEQLRRAFIDICLHRASAEQARTESMLSGEYYLGRHEVHAPKLGLQESRPRTTDKTNDQTPPIGPKA